LAFSGNFKKRLNRANKINAKVAVLIGEDEVRDRFFTIKDMDTGEQTKFVPKPGYLHNELAYYLGPIVDPQWRLKKT
jgi:hypothetical protein